MTKETDDLQQLMVSLARKRDSELRERFDRSLPFADALFDRWERAKQLGFGADTSIYNSSAIFGSVQIGENTWVGPWTLLDGSGGDLSIGSYCSVSAGVQIYTHDTAKWAVSGGRAPKKTGTVTISDRVYLGSQSIITCGVTIGTRSVIGANSLVNQDIPENTIAAGTPARPIGRVEVDGDQVKFLYE